MQSCFENVFIESIALLICFPNPHSVKYVDVGGLLSDRLWRAKQTKKTVSYNQPNGRSSKDNERWMGGSKERNTTATHRQGGLL